MRVEIDFLQKVTAVNFDLVSRNLLLTEFETIGISSLKKLVLLKYYIVIIQVFKTIRCFLYIFSKFQMKIKLKLIKIYLL